MPHITISRHDGEYAVRVVDLPEAGTAGMADVADPGEDVLYVEDAVLRAWRRHEDEHAAWGAHWRAVENEQHVQRRMAALRPLEVAEDRIRALEEEELVRMRRGARVTSDVVEIRHRHTKGIMMTGTPGSGAREVVESATLRMVDLAGADLGLTNLSSAHLTWANLPGADLTAANLTYAHLMNAVLRDAVLDYANLAHAGLNEANLMNASLRNANLSGAFPRPFGAR